MGVFGFDDDSDDDLKPFPRKPLKRQAHAAALVKDAELKIGFMSHNQAQVSRDNKKDLPSTQDSCPVNGSLQEAASYDLRVSEVTVIGEDLVFARINIQLSWLEFKFMLDSILLKFSDDCGNPIAINFPLNEIKGFGFGTCQQTAKDVLELTLTKDGIKLLEHNLKGFLKKDALSCDEDSTLSTRLKKFNGSGLAKEITSLSDRYKVLWRPRQLNNHNEISVNALNWRGCRNTDVEKTTWSDLIYPRGDPDAVTVTLDDFLLLNPCEFISDTIIDFYIKYLQSRLPEDEKKRFHFFNSFFYRKLVKLDSDSGSEQTGSWFEHLRRWTRGIDIFEKDFLFIPIMQRAHWSLIIVCHPGELFKDGCQESCNCKRTLILHFDSMEGFHKGVGKPIEKYLVTGSTLKMRRASGV